ncbi:MAG: 6-phosphofructokinase [Oligoflexia bacterium]|nr:6-phosphofructokinase [Oligoflexia bacterium]
MNLRLPAFPKKKKLSSFAVLTSGGDAPGMNAAVRAVVRYGIANGCEVHGIIKGYSGLIEGLFQRMDASSVANILQRGGTILKTDRCEEFYKKSVRREAAEILRRRGIQGLVVIGGDGSFTGASLLEAETGFPTIGVPGTIDNDIAGTDDTIGFDTAVNTAIDAIDRIRDTASSHDRIFLVEVMGRSSGFIALEVGIGGGAETIIVPERKESLASICSTIDRGIRRGKTSSIIVVAEGEKAGLSAQLAGDLEKRGYKSRVCILGHTQRGGSPTAHDRMLASALGASAAAFLMGGKSNAMVGVQRGVVTLVPFKSVIGVKKGIPPELLTLAQVLAT